MAQDKTINLVSGFIESSRRFANRPALDVDDQIYTYAELAGRAGAIAQVVKNAQPEDVRVAAVYAYRSITAYAGVLGVLLAGKGYVPLNPDFPEERTFRMLNMSGARVMVVGKECVSHLPAVLAGYSQPMTLILPDTPDDSRLAQQWPAHTFCFQDDLPAHNGPLELPRTDPDQTAYLLFTSGSTGVPKGVPVSHRNGRAYIDNIYRIYDFNEEDRFSQTFDMTFDLSVHDMFVSWECGACLCCVPRKFTLAPARFIRDKALSIWFSVPSVGMFMSKMRMLTPGAFPSLRISLFCGEPLPVSTVEQWCAAAPNSTLENLYGPTEATIAIARYVWETGRSEAQCVNGIVPIGWIFETQKHCVVDDKLKPLSAGQNGELCLGGSQVTAGYLNNPEKTAAQFVHIPDKGEGVWYRTGDLVVEGEDGCLKYLGRADHQVKILGHRVELQEIDHALREASGCEMAVAIAWPIENGSAGGVVGFISGGNEAKSKEILARCHKTLPEYMVPRRLVFIGQMPLNVNGKCDRLQLRRMLEEEEAHV